MVDDSQQKHDQANRSEDLEEEPAELSLAELSEAYASVLKQNERKGNDEAVEAELDEHELDESAEDQDHRAASERKPATIHQMDAVDNASCQVSPKTIVESLLFVGSPTGERLTLKKIAAVMRDVSPKEVKKTIEELNEGYQEQNTAFRVVEDEGHYMLQLCDDLREVQNYFFGRNKAAKLSQGTIDVLAIVAYHQPISKSKIEKIRSRPSGSVIGQLIRRNLITQIDGESKKKEKRYQTTDRFLQLFGLETLDDLPQTSVVSDLEELTDY